VVGADHNDDVGPLVAQQVEALQDGLGRAAGPALAGGFVGGGPAGPWSKGFPGRGGAGTEGMWEFSIPSGRQVCDTCRSRLCDLYCVSTTIWRSCELIRLDSAKSMSRYCPPNGTAGFARSAVNGISRFPSPPASTMPKIFLPAAIGTTVEATGGLY